MSAGSKAYANFAESSFSWKFIERLALDRALPESAYDEHTRILDIGSGSGRVIDYHIQKGAREANMVGIDPDKESINIARQRFPHTLFLLQKAQDLELESSAFDIVTAQLVLRYLDNGELLTLIKKVSTALREGGVFFILDVHPARYGVTDGFDQYFQEGPRSVNTPWGGSEKYYYRTLATYARTVINAGLHLVMLDECPIAEGVTDGEYSKGYARYSVSPARFAMLAKKPE